MTELDKTQEEYQNYEDSLKYYRDLKNSLDTAKEEGLQQGIQQGIKQGIKQGIRQGIEQEKIEIAKKGLKEGYSIDIISKLTGLPVDEIKSLK